MQMSKYPSIGQFRNVIKQVQIKTQFAGFDENGEAIVDRTRLMPTLTFKGTIKLHGTNSAVCQNFKTSEIWYQSRENVLSLLKDNAGFMNYMDSINSKSSLIKDFFTMIEAEANTNYSNSKSAYIYGEWCGGSIQKGVALNQLPKMFVVFGIKLKNEDDEGIWLPDDVVKNIIGHNVEERIFNIFEFENYSIDIDFNNPNIIQNKLIEITEAVEACCPVGKYFGVEGCGEGVVWKCETYPYVGGNFLFKVKGSLHAGKSKVKVLASVDTEKMNSIQECVDSIVSENRLNQGLEYLTLNGFEIDPKSTGPFIKWITGDCIKEEKDTILDSGLFVEDVCSAIAKKAKLWFFTQLGN